MERWWVDIGRRKPSHTARNLSQCNFVHQKSQHRLTWDRTLASLVTGRRLTASRYGTTEEWVESKVTTKTYLTLASPCHHHTIQKNQPTRCNSFTRLLLDVYVWLNMFRAPLRPSSGAHNCTSNLWF
jgi:hypothetical protein